MNTVAYFDSLVYILQAVTGIAIGLIFVNFWTESDMTADKKKKNSEQPTPFNTPLDHLTEVT